MSDQTNLPTGVGGFKAEGDVMHPTGVCRGCAGLGIGQHVAPRIIQIIEGVQGYQWRFDPPLGTRRKQRFVRITPIVYDQAKQQGVFYGPYAVVLDHVMKLVAEGFTYDPACIPIETDWGCEWCHGTGQPQLSVATLEAAMRRSSRLSDSHNGGRRYE